MEGKGHIVLFLDSLPHQNSGLHIVGTQRGGKRFVEGLIHSVIQIPESSWFFSSLGNGTKLTVPGSYSSSIVFLFPLA